MKYLEGSPISFTPDHSNEYKVELFDAKGSTGPMMIIGWAIVPVGSEGDATATAIIPVVYDTRARKPLTVEEVVQLTPKVVGWRLA
jgi:hypothetical protein